MNNYDRQIKKEIEECYRQKDQQIVASRQSASKVYRDQLNFKDKDMVNWKTSAS